MSQSHSGGCQCGKVRYRVSGPLTNSHICHCRMCQKAAGNAFMALANAQKKDFEMTRGDIAWFRSSEGVRRGYCRDCGTPLIFDSLAAKHLNVTLGSLDRPEEAPPQRQWGVESRLPWFAGLAGLREGETVDDLTATSRQHPDHD